MDTKNPFDFLKNKEQALYLQFSESWKNYKTDFVYANDKLRTGIIKFAEIIIRKEEKEIDMRQLKNQEKIERLIEKGILPNNEQYSELVKKRNQLEYEKMNVTSQDINRYEIVMDLLYQVLYKQYEKKKPKQMLNYYYFPIQNYQIIKYEKTEFLGREQVEYLAIRENQYKIKEMCIIREYHKKKQIPFTHEQTVAILLRGNSLKEPENLMKMIEIETKESNPYCYIAYAIDESMKNLAQMELKNLAPKEKINLIKDIINGVLELGVLSNYKINHRNISPENIYVTKTRNHYVAKLGKFELTKIEMNQEEYESAYRYVKKQYEKENFSCYYPKAGWEKSRTYEEWEKVDVYSLGKIIEFICFNKVIPMKYQIEDFKQRGYPEKLGEIYLKMVNQIADKRPTIKEIKEEMRNMRGGKLFWKKKIL